MSRILVVEDSPTIAAGLSAMLQSNGYEVTVAEDGLAAFGALTRAKPSLILMDIGLPGIQGLDLCLTIRQLPAFATIPIIIVTGSHRHIDVAMARHMGATAYLTKPVKHDELLALVNSTLSAQAA